MSLDETKKEQAVKEAVSQLKEAAAAKKCWTCGCLHNSLTAIEKAFPEDKRPKEIQGAVQTARERLQEVRYDCLGCEICYPALAINALNQISEDPLNTLEACPAEKTEEREGWPPLPGNYRVLRYRAAVAVCTLTSDELFAAVAREAGPAISIVGTLQTENLGIERLILNILANPFIRFLVVCGVDSQQAIGHLPGQSLVALAQYGFDERMRIVGARGKRPVLRNLSGEAIAHFRRMVGVVDLVGETKAEMILEKAAACGGKDPGPSETFLAKSAVTAVKGYVPERMVSDPAGYFVIHADLARKSISVEHYRNDGLLDAVVEGKTAAELYIPIIDKGLISVRLWRTVAPIKWPGWEPGAKDAGGAGWRGHLSLMSFQRQVRPDSFKAVPGQPTRPERRRRARRATQESKCLRSRGKHETRRGGF